MLGPSGSGKSTLTLCLDGLIPHLVEGDYAGEVVVAGLVVGDTPVHLLAQETGLVFQDPDSQFCTLTVEDEIAFGLENLRRPPAEIETAIDARSGSGRPGRLSAAAPAAPLGRREAAGGPGRGAGHGAAAAGARRALRQPRPAATAELFALLRRLAADRRHTIVIIEHKLDEIIEWVDSVLVLGAGRPAALSRATRGRPSTSGHASWRPWACGGRRPSELVPALRGRGLGGAGEPSRRAARRSAALAATPGLLDRLRAPSRPRVAGAAPRGERSGPPLLRAET